MRLLRRWWCALTTHKWRRSREEGVDILVCNRCGYRTGLAAEAERRRLGDMGRGV